MTQPPERDVLDNANARNVICAARSEWQTGYSVCCRFESSGDGSKRPEPFGFARVVCLPEKVSR
ncbi:MAG: hypothetical protein EKK48_16980 [Candidatus Melainabacteria bacterium]|nr:MAG: hypothetical protein EKK48_16980 [Candidatus Melainabacteria bacterium]